MTTNPAEVNLTLFPLQRYAELTVALAAGEERAQALRRFILTEEIFVAVATRWGERMKEDPRIQAEFLEHVQAARRARQGG